MHPENSLSVKIMNPSRFFQCFQLGSTICPKVLKTTHNKKVRLLGSLFKEQVSPNLGHRTYIYLCQTIHFW